jgi:hypothetical protein
MAATTAATPQAATAPGRTAESLRRQTRVDLDAAPRPGLPPGLRRRAAHLERQHVRAQVPAGVRPERARQARGLRQRVGHRRQRRAVRVGVRLLGRRRCGLLAALAALAARAALCRHGDAAAHACIPYGVSAGCTARLSPSDGAAPAVAGRPATRRDQWRSGLHQPHRAAAGAGGTHPSTGQRHARPAGARAPRGRQPPWRPRARTRSARRPRAGARRPLSSAAALPAQEQQRPASGVFGVKITVHASMCRVQDLSRLKTRAMSLVELQVPKTNTLHHIGPAPNTAYVD